MTVERTRKFQIRGAQQFTNNGEFRLDFNDLSPLSIGHTSVRWIELAVDVRWANATAGPLVIPENIGHNIIRSIQCRVPGGHTFFDLSSQAGESLLKSIWQRSGSRPESPGDVTVGAAGVFNARYKIILPIGYLFGAIEPDDYNVPLKELQRGQASVEIQWANGAAGGDFDAGAGGCTVTAANTQVRQATVLLIARSEQRVGPYLTYKQQLMSGLEERPLTANHVVHQVVEIPTANPPGATALTEVFVTAAGRTQVDEFSFDGVNVVEQVPAADLITVSNRKMKTAADRITQHEAGTTEVLPIYTSPTDAAKSTHAPSSREHPNLRMLGTTATPRLVYVLSRLVDDRAFMESASKLGVQADPSTAQAKTVTKTALDRRSGAGAFFRLPRKIG